MERQGSGFKKITESYYAAHNYRKELKPGFYSEVTSVIGDSVAAAGNLISKLKAASLIVPVNGYGN